MFSEGDMTMRNLLGGKGANLAEMTTCLLYTSIFFDTDAGYDPWHDREGDDREETGIYDVHKIANNEKVVPRDWMNEDANYVTDKFIDYIEPLIQGDYPPFMVNGLPQHLVLKR